MRVNSALAGESGGAHPPPFNISTIMYKAVVYAPAERADTLPIFLLYPYVYFCAGPHPSTKGWGRGWKSVLMSTEKVQFFL